MESVQDILQYMVFVWLGIGLLLLVIEGLTMGLTTIWFTIGAAVAAVLAAFEVSIVWQIAAFIVVSVVTLIFTRPIAIKKLKIGREKNVIDQCIGETAIVINDIKPFSTGQIRLKSLEWSAVSCNPEDEILKDQEVEVLKIEGVKAIVKPLKDKSIKTEC